MLTNFGASRFNGGLNLVANLLGKPGKMDVQGHMVQDLWNEGKLAEINDYCRCDVLDTYFAFLRTMVLLGNLKLDDEQRIVQDIKDWLTERASTIPIYAVVSSGLGDMDQSVESGTGDRSVSVCAHSASPHGKDYGFLFSALSSGMSCEGLAENER